jgi:flagellar basal-body rod modification protein FlgD
MSTLSNAASIFAPTQVSTTSSNSSSSATSAAQAASSSASQQLAGNFDTFLQLPTTRLQNQNPLDPLDTNQSRN